MGVERRKMTTHSQCLLHTLLPILLLHNTWVSAGFISPGNSVSIRTSPTLRFLLACGHLTTKPPIFYTNEQVAKGLRHLQAALGLPETGVEGEQERRVVKKGKCINNSPKSIKIAPAKIQQTSNPSVEVFAPPARYDTQEQSVEVFAPSSNRPSAPYVEQKNVNKVKKKTFSGCGAGLYGVGLRALSSCGSTFLS